MIDTDHEEEKKKPHEAVMKVGQVVVFWGQAVGAVEAHCPPSGREHTTILGQVGIGEVGPLVAYQPLLDVLVGTMGMGPPWVGEMAHL